MKLHTSPKIKIFVSLIKSFLFGEAMGFLWDFLSVSSNKKIEYFTLNYQLKIRVIEPNKELAS